MKYKSEDSRMSESAVKNFDGLFRGLGNVIKAATDLAEKSEEIAEFSRTRLMESPSGAQGICGFSVRVGPARRPAFRKPATLRRESVPTPNMEFRDSSPDLFDEGDHYLIVAEVPGADESSVQWHINNGVLRIQAAAEGRQYQKELQLTCPINERNAAATFKNGILELRLWKQ